MPCPKQPAVEHCIQSMPQTPSAQVPNGQPRACNRQSAQTCMAQTVPNEDIDDDFMYGDALSLHTNQKKQTAVTKV